MSDKDGFRLSIATRDEYRTLQISPKKEDGKFLLRFYDGKLKSLNLGFKHTGTKIEEKTIIFIGKLFNEEDKT